jgi:CHAT domain-containing protein/tetratricopeptide (TPR) repeat protein
MTHRTKGRNALSRRWRWCQRRAPESGASRTRRLTAAALATVLSSPVLASASAQSREIDSQAASWPAVDERLPDHAADWRAIRPGQATLFWLDAADHHYIEIAAECRGLTITIVAETARRTEEARDVCHPLGWTRLNFVATTSQKYRILVRAADRAAGSGAYRVWVPTDRVAMPDDALRVLAQQAFARGEIAANVPTAASRLRALSAYESAGRTWRRVGDAALESVAMSRSADVEAGFGHSQTAERMFSRALAAANAAGDVAAQAIALNGLSQVEFRLGNVASAESQAQLALERGRTGDAAAQEADALNNLGDIDAYSGRLPESLVAYRTAFDTADAAGDIHGVSRALLNTGFSNADLRRWPEAEAAYERSISLAEVEGDRATWAVAQNALGQLHSARGEKQEALDAYYRARAVFERLADPYNLGLTFNGIGSLYVEMGEPGPALEFFRRQFTAEHTAGYVLGETGALARIGYCYYLLNQPANALGYLERSLAQLRRLAFPSDEALWRGWLGLTYEALGRFDEALDSYRLALALVERIGDRREEAYVLDRMARLEARAGLQDQALASLERARQYSVAAMDREGESLSLFNTALIEADLKRLDTAVAHVRESLSISESVRSNVVSLDLRSSFFANIRDRHELLVTLLMQLEAARPGQGYDADAFQAAEAAKARSLRDAVVRAGPKTAGGVDPALLQRDERLRIEVTQAINELASLRASKAPPTVLRHAEAELNRLLFERRTLDEQIRARKVPDKDLVDSSVITVGDARRSVGDSEATLVEYFLARDHSFVWTVTASRVTSHELPPRRTIDALVRSFREQVIAPTAGPEPGGRVPARSDAATRLTDVLLQPVASELGSTVVLVPDGSLYLLPFAALPDPADPHRQRPLITNHVIVSAPSAGMVAATRDRIRRPAPRQPVLIFGDPVFERDDPRVGGAAALVPHSPGPLEPSSRPMLTRALRDIGLADGAVPRLLGTREEAKAIASIAPGATLALGFDATRDAVVNGALDRYRIVHFATHGVVDSSRPELSGIVLSLVTRDGRPQDGFLRLSDIYDLNLPVDLVVLSSCDGGLGKEVQGEGLVGLVRGFMYAGSRRVVASLWKADDAATTALMTAFYRGMFERQLAPAAALRAAQLEVRRTPRWHAPFYWAGFVLQGEPGS